MSKTPQALEIRDHNAIYYIIENNHEFVTDFCIYKKNNWITIEQEYLKDAGLIKEIANLSALTVITTYIAAEDKKLLEELENIYPNHKVEEEKQGNWSYYKLIINL